MKKIITPASLLALLLSSTSLFAQQEEKVIVEEKRIEKGGDNQEVIIRKKGDKDTKMTVEIKDGKVTINGKPVEEFNDENATVIIRKGGPRVVVGQPGRFRSFGGPGNFEEFDIEGGPFKVEGMPAMPGMPGADNLYFSGPMNKALLGVTSDGKNGGATITNITPNSGAEKAGLKKGDVITSINSDEIKSPADLTEAIGKYKPEEKVNITYKRDGKTLKTTATLGKNNQMATTLNRSYGFTAPGGEMNNLYREFNFDSDQFPRLAMGRPRLGIKAQDTEEGKGVKVLEVADDSQAAKAGIKKDDIITRFNGVAINSTDDLLDAAEEAHDKSSVSVELIRNGSTQTVEIKTPKKLKTANL